MLIGVLLWLALGHVPAHAERVTYIHADALGSPVAATDAGGALLWQEYYRPYGDRERLQGDDSNRVWYTGKAQDPGTLLVYMGARYYNPLTGRFVSTDPVDFKEGNAHSFNRYAYANNNPYAFVDPDGRSAITILAKTIYKGGNITAATVGIREDYSTLTNPNTTRLDKIAAAGSLVSEILPLGARDLKAVMNIAEDAATKLGRAGRQERLRELAQDDKLGSADRGWLKQEINAIERGQRSSIRNPPGKDLAHERGREAAKGYNYEHSALQDRSLHRTQHKFDDFGRKNAERPVK
jgi:RHS repeat-associated protein